MKDFAEKVWLGGHIYTVDRFFSTATALACSGDRITAVGSDSEMEALIGPDTEVVRLQGAVVLPGLIVLASMQATHAPNSASMALRRIGAERASRAYAGGLVLETLGMVASESDAPVAQPDQLDGIHSAVTRTNGVLSPAGGFFPQNAFTRKQAIQSYTIWGAYAQFAEHDKGSLELGKLADFVILDVDPMTVEADDLLKIQVVNTIVGGETVYQKD